MTKVLTFVSLGFFLYSCQTATEDTNLFAHFTVSKDLPDHGPEARYGTPALADFDNDGDIDYAMSITRHELLWFEFLGDHKWDMHKAGEVAITQLAGGSYDIDQDGWMDIVIGGYWYRNTHDPKNEEFIRIEYDSTIKHEIHDLVLADMDADGRQDVVVLGDKDGCFWYEIPENPLQDKAWKRHVISLDVVDSRSDIHGGFFPGGVGDVDGDGDADVVMPNRWYRNENGGTTFTKQFLPFGSGGYWGLSGRSWILDMDLDGDNDIVAVSGDQKDSRGAWLENNGNKNPRFTVHLLPLTAPGRRGSFHSLWVADFDLDGDHDIFTMDQEDHTILPEGAGLKAYMWENIDGKGGEFEEHVVLDKNIGGHDCQFADVDGDGDLDAYFKVWSNLESNTYGGLPHVDYLENLTID